MAGGKKKLSGAQNLLRKRNRESENQHLGAKLRKYFHKPETSEKSTSIISDHTHDVDAVQQMSDHTDDVDAVPQMSDHTDDVDAVPQMSGSNDFAHSVHLDRLDQYLQLLY